MALAKGSYEVKVPFQDEKGVKSFLRVQAYKVPAVPSLIIVGREDDSGVTYTVSYVRDGTSLGMQHKHLAGARRLARMFYEGLPEDIREAFDNGTIADKVSQRGVASRLVNLRRAMLEKWS